MCVIDTNLLSQTMKASVLCWLATADETGQPNVSPKEIFCSGAKLDEVLIAEIASPVSLRNIGRNEKVCVSLVDVFSQKGIKVYGQADIIQNTDPRFQALALPLIEMAGPSFFVRAVIRIKVTGTVPILAPSYKVFPERTEEEQRDRGYLTYGVSKL